MSSIGTLTIEMAANIVRLQQDMQAAKNAVGEATSEIKRMAEFAKTALEALGIAATAHEFKEMVSSFIEGAARLKDFSYQTGASVESLSQMQAVGKLANTSLDQIVGAADKLAKNMAASTGPTSAVAQAIKALGLNFNDLMQLSPDGRLRAIAEAMSRFEDGGGKAAVAMTLLGREGANLIPFLRDLAERQDILATTSDADAAAAKRFSDSLVESKMRMEALERSIALGLLPMLSDIMRITQLVGTALTQYMNPAVEASAGGFDAAGIAIAAIGYTFETITVLGANVAFVFTSITREIGALAAQAAALASGDFAGFSRIHEMAVADAAAARDALDKFSASVVGSTDKVLAARDALKNHSISAQEAANEVQRMTAAHGAAKQAALDFRVATDNLTDGYAAFIAKIRNKIDATQLEIDKGRALTDGEKLQIEAEKLAREGKISHAQASSDLTWKLTQQIDATERSRQAMYEAQKATLAAAQAHEKAYVALDQEIGKIGDQIAAQNAANVAVVSGKDASEAMAVAKLREQAATAELNAIKVEEKNLDFAMGEQYRELSARLLELADSREKGIGLKAAQQAAEAWKKSIDSISNGLTDALYRAFESGKGFMDAFVSTLKNAFKALVLEPTIRAIIAPVGSAIGGLLGVPSVANASTGSSALGGLGSLSSLSSLGSSLALMGGNFAAGFGATLSGANLFTTLGSASDIGGLAGLAGGIGAVAPWALGAIAIGSLLTNDPNATLGYGSTTGNRFLGFGNGRDAGSQKAAADAAAAIRTSIGSSAAAFGGRMSDTLNIQVSTDIDRKGIAAGGIALFDTTGRTFVPGYTSSVPGYNSAIVDTVPDSWKGGKLLSNLEKGGMSTADMQKWIESNTATAVVLGLQNSDLPKKFADWFGSVSAQALTPEKAQQMLSAAQSAKTLTDALSPLGGVFASLGNLSVSATGALVDLAGGLDAFLGKANSYVQSYYSASEQAAIAAVQVNATLKAAGIDTSALTSKDAYRAMVDATAGTLETAAGREQLNALLGAAGAFAQLADKLGGGSLASLAAGGTGAGGIADVLASATKDQTDIARAGLDAQQISTIQLEHVNTGITSMSDRITGAIDSMRASLEAGRASLEAGLASIAASTANTAKQLRDWDSGGAMVTTTTP